ncbi:hypothetical protein HBA54_18875 [Pelagibius litoralis]|uniref:Uncharacterized protein n=1 Tax=Pelagibius litoralis TaxID=374515 RepID=A0A967KGW1_9PROT|nr:hypothetical protein [Pelagibius litoralis]NIA70666.1 hypothetical protein [Pelagibius litoralis]
MLPEGLQPLRFHVLCLEANAGALQKYDTRVKTSPTNAGQPGDRTSRRNLLMQNKKAMRLL